MLSFPARSLLALVLVLSVVIGSRGETPAPKPTTKQIAQWIEQLGDNDFAAREKATKKLWQAGAAAESALEKALKSDDPEVVRRARELLEKFHWGIYPDTPADIVALIRAYQSSKDKPRLEVFQKLMDSGEAGLRAVGKIGSAEKDEDQRKALRDLFANPLHAAFLQTVTEEKYEHFERLLERGREGKIIDLKQYAAYWLLRGKLPETIARFAARLREHPDDAWAAQTLAYLHRANGDLMEARLAAEKSGRGDLLEGILYEAGDWLALTGLTYNEERERGSEKGNHHIAGTPSPVEKWAFRAAYARLAGKQVLFDNALTELRKFKETGDKPDASPFVAAKALLLNDRPTDGLDLLAKTKDRTILFDILCTRLDFAKALELEEKPSTANPKFPTDIDFWRARTLYFLGDKEEANKRFSHIAEFIKDDVDPYWVVNLLMREYRAGLKDLAFEHCAKVLSVAPRKSLRRRDGGPMEESFLAQVFPEQATVAEVWWLLFREKFKEESGAAVLKRVRQLIEGKIAAKEIKGWIEEGDLVLSQLSSQPTSAVSNERLPSYRQALAETAAKAGLDDLASSLLVKADSRDALIRLGDLLAAKNQWAKAAERYQQAWKKELLPEKPRANFTPLPGRTPDPLSLYLAGDALVHAGQEKEGKKLIEQSHWLPLADVGTRFNFLRALAQRGHAEAAQRESELLLHVSEPNSYYSGEALRHRALAALKRKEYLKAAEGLEQSMLRCLHRYTNFVSDAAYVNVPAQIHQYRAQGLLAAGKLDDALKQADLALAVAPGYVNLPIALVPELERRGHNEEATALFNRCYGAYEKVCRAYPRCAWAHNSSAWMSACCRRNLDKALQHAEKAIELAPANAGYLDTLAEVHFQRGDKAKAIASQKRAIVLDPKRAYYHKQMKRLEAGDPSAERPPEDDE